MDSFRNSPEPSPAEDQASHALARVPEAPLPPLESEGAQGQSSAAEYVWLFWRKKLLIAGAGLAGLLCAAVLLLNKPILYSARTTIELHDMNESFLGINQVDPRASAHTSQPSSLQTQLLILESESLRAEAIDAIKRHDSLRAPAPYGYWGQIRARLKGRPDTSRDSIEQAIGFAANTLRVTPLRGSRIVELRCESTNPEVAALFVNILAAEYDNERVAARVKSTREMTLWFDAQLNTLKRKLETSEEQLQQYMRQSGVIVPANSPDEQDTLANSKLKQLQKELAAVQTDRIVRQTRVLQASSTGGSVSDASDDGAVRAYRQRIAELRREMAELLSTLTPAHYKVKRIAAQIEEMESAMKLEQANSVKRINEEYEAAKAREQLLQQAYTAESRVVAAQAEKAIQYNILKREVESARATYNAMLQQGNQASVAAAVTASSMRILDAAKPANSPSKPQPTSTLAIGLAGGVVLGCLIIAVREKVDQTVRAPGQVPILLQVSELGVIPSADFAPKGASLFRRRNGHKPDSLLGSASETREDVALTTWLQKPSLIAESFRATATSLSFAGMHGQLPRMVVVTSPGAHEGKTTVATNLGIAIAELGRRTLLVDADLRRPRLQDIFRISGGPGLAHLLQESTPVARLMRTDLASATSVPNLFVLPAGSLEPDSIHALLRSERMRSLLHRLRNEFDVVIIDSPPLLQFPDSRILGRGSDGVVLVLRSGATDRAQALTSYQRLRDDGIALFGTILNHYSPTTTDAYAYSYYSREVSRAKA